MNDTSSKRDGGNVAFTRGAQAENKPQRARRQTSLVRVRYDGRIEQGSGFQRVLREEIGADQEPPSFGYVLKRQRLAHLFEALEEELADLLVALRKLSGYFGQQLPSAVFRERHDPGDDPGYPLGTTRAEGPEENPGLVRMEDCGGTFEIHGYWGPAIP